MDKEKCCDNCKWLEIGEYNFYQICTNESSKYNAFCVDEDDCCENYEEKER